ncbi:hypothetical protein EV359DRAFT_87862 [Lentinula novae-zelandiae]|nr:hypothetical protein EV359DRAFT_87862 [Lentinula novae-zelandiae]
MAQYLAPEAIRMRVLGYSAMEANRWKTGSTSELKQVEESHDMTFKEGTPHRTRMTEEVNEEEGLGEETTRMPMSETDTLDPRPNTPANTTEATGSGNQPPAQRKTTQIPEGTHMEVDAPIIVPEPPCRSEWGQIPSHRQLKSNKYKERKQMAQERGESWTADTPLALIAQHPYAFAAASRDLWVPQSYKQAM